MNVELTPDEKVFVRQAVEDGRFAREEDAVLEAMAIWEERERRRLEILAMVDEAEASLARGEGRELTKDSMQALAERTKERLRPHRDRTFRHLSLMPIASYHRRMQRQRRSIPTSEVDPNPELNRT